MTEENFLLKINGKQLRVLTDVLGEFWQIRENKWDRLADTLVREAARTRAGDKETADEPDHGMSAERYAAYRDCVQYALEAAGKMMWSPDDGNGDVSRERTIAKEVWAELRGQDGGRDGTGKRHVVRLTKEQLFIVRDAAEEYCRIRMYQWWYLSSLAYFKDGPNHEELFDAYITRRECARCQFETAERILMGLNRFGNDRKSDDQLIAEDIWRVIRYRLYIESGSTDTSRTDAWPPLHVGSEPLPECVKEER